MYLNSNNYRYIFVLNISNISKISEKYFKNILKNQQIVQNIT